MKILRTKFPDVFAIEPQRFADDRGFFVETYHRELFRGSGVQGEFVQDNHSHSIQWVLRGLHFQSEEPQGKLVRVVTGEVFDVVVDIRRGSPTCGEWSSMRLSADQDRLLWIPPGFAHGFLVMSESADFVYKATTYYRPEAQRTIAWNDPGLNIPWPLPDGVKPVLSPKDECGSAFSQIELL